MARIVHSLASIIMNTENNSPTPSAGDREIISRRVFNIPRSLIYSAWTDPEQLAQWWGPEGFTNTFYEFNLKPGGEWRFVMHGPDGKDYQNHSVFVEIIPQERIVFDHISLPKFRVTATFEQQAEKTKVTFRMHFESKVDVEKLKALIVPANEQNFDRLEALIARRKKSA